MNNPDFGLNATIVALQVISLAAMVILFTHRTWRPRCLAWLLVLGCVLGLGLTSTVRGPGDTDLVMFSAATVGLLLLAALSTAQGYEDEPNEGIESEPASGFPVGRPTRRRAYPARLAPVRVSGQVAGDAHPAYLTRRAGGLSQLSV